MRRVIVFGVLALLVLSAGCGGKSTKTSPPAKKASSSLALLKQMSVDEMWASTHKQYKKVWAYVYPGYRSVTTFAFWEGCKRKDAAKPSKIVWLSFAATSTSSKSMRLSLLGKVKVEIVTVMSQFTYKGKTVAAPFELYWARVNGHWRNLWSPREVKAYKAHRCPS